MKLSFTFHKSVDNLFNRLKTVDGQAWLRKRVLAVNKVPLKAGVPVALFKGIGMQHGNAIVVLYGAREFRRDTLCRDRSGNYREYNVLTVVKVKNGEPKGKPFYVEL